MINVFIIYPVGKRFDWNYYLKHHLPMVRTKLKTHIVSLRVGKGEEGISPSPLAFMCIVHMVLANKKGLDALKSIGPEASKDIPNFTDVMPIMQISEILNIYPK